MGLLNPDAPIAPQEAPPQDPSLLPGLLPWAMPCILDTSISYPGRSFYVPSSSPAFAKAPLKSPCPSGGFLAENTSWGHPPSTAPARVLVGAGSGPRSGAAAHWWQLCHSQVCRGRFGRKSAVPWFFTRWGKRSSTRTS